MASPTQGPVVRTFNVPVHVLIGVDPNSGTLRVTPDPFWVHTQEEVEWDCALPHAQHGPNCFTVEFKNKSPFKARAFKGHASRTGTPVVPPDLTTLYDYSIEAPGYPVLDPQGGVKP